MTILLIESAVKGLAILLLAAFAAAVVSRKSAAVKHLVWSSAMLGLLAIPLLTATVPSWRVSVPALAALTPATLTQSPVDRTLPTPVGRTVAAPSAASTAATHHNSATAPSGLIGTEAAVKALPVEPRTGAPASSAFPVLLVLWGIGFTVFLFDLLRGHVAAFRATRRANVAVDERLVRQLTSACDALGVSDDINLRLSGDVAVPCTWGIRVPGISWARPTVLLPTAALRWDDERLSMVMAHELGHVKRLDWVTQGLTYLACAVHWFNPIAWSARRRMLQEQEAATDDLVLQLGSRAHAYASSLLDIARASACFRPRIGGLTSATIAMSRPSSLETRLVAILDAQLERSAIYGRRVLGTAAVVMLLAVPLAAFQPAPVATEPIAATTTPDDAAAMSSLVLAPFPIDFEVETPASEESLTDAPRVADAGSKPIPSPEAAPRDAQQVAAADLTSDAPSVAAVPMSPDSNKVRVLLEALAGEEDAEVRVYLVRILGEMKNRLAVGPMADLLSRDASVEVREHAAWALGELGDRSAISHLQTALASESSEEVRDNVLWALTELDAREAVSAIEAALANDPSADIRETAAWALGDFGAESSAAVLENALRDEDASVRQKAAWALGELGLDRSVAALTPALRDGEDDVRELAAWALGEIGSSAAAGALIGGLNDESASVRRHVIRALGAIGADDAADKLLEILQNDPDREVRKMAAYALSQLDF